MKVSPAQLASMTKEQKLALLDAIEEKRRRARLKKDTYKPNAGQLPVHKSDKVLRCVFSGNGAGKTTMLVQEAFWVANGYNPITKEHTPVPAVVAIVLDKPEKLEKRWLPEIRKWFELRPEQFKKNGKPYVSQIVFDNGSVIDFYFHEQDELTTESIEVDFGGFDEPPPRRIYVGLRRGGRKKGRRARFLMVGTPISQAWMREEIYEPWSKGLDDSIDCFTTSSRVNEANLSDTYWEDFGGILSDKEKATRFEGAFFDLDGLALKSKFKQEVHVLENDFADDWGKENPCVVVIDPHPSKAHVALLAGVDRHNQIYALDEFIEKSDGRIFSRNLIAKGWFKKYRIIDIVYDSLGNSENRMGEGFKPFGIILNEELKAAGIGRARATSYDEKSDEDFVERIKDVLLIPEKPNNFGQCLPQLRILRRVKGLIGDIETVQWKKDKANDQNKPSLDIAKKDTLACLKYALATNIHYKKPKERAYAVKREAYGIKIGGIRRS